MSVTGILGPQSDLERVARRGGRVGDFLRRAVGRRDGLVGFGILAVFSILAIAQGRSYQPGEGIVKEAEPGDEMFVLFRGKVNVVKGDQPAA